MRFLTRSFSALLSGTLILCPAAAKAADMGATVAIADMGGSGNSDIIALDAANQEVDMVWVSKSGGFSLSTQDFSDIGAMTAVTVADVNGDGRPDVIVADGSGTAKGVRVLLNKGDGTLAPDMAYVSDTAAGPGPVSVTVADVNGDGRPDIITANGSAGTVSVLLNKGDGSFTAPITYAAGADPVAVAVGDFNGDGFADLVVADASGNSVQLLLNDGRGGFAAPVAQAVGAQPVALTVADVDGDGRPDVLVADQGDDTVAVLLGHGDGSFAPATFCHTGSRPGWIAAQDLTGDGRLDLATDNYSDGSVSLFANTGHGFGSQRQLFPAYGSYDTVIMSIGGIPQVVSLNVQAGQVQVTPAAAAMGVGNAAQTTLRRIDGYQDPPSSTARGAVDMMSLVLLGLASLIRRRPR